MDRRSLIKTGSLITVSVAVPSWLTGCGTEQLEAVKKTEVPYNGLPIINSEWQDRAKQLENAGVVKSRKNTPAHNSTEQEMAAHLPIITFGNDKVSINVNHPMEETHWVTTIYCKDQAERVFGLVEFLAADEKPFAEFALPVGTTDVLAFVFCNVHDHWCEKLKRPHT